MIIFAVLHLFLAAVLFWQAVTYKNISESYRVFAYSGGAMNIVFAGLNLM